MSPEEQSCPPKLPQLLSLLCLTSGVNEVCTDEQNRAKAQELLPLELNEWSCLVAGAIFGVCCPFLTQLRSQHGLYAVPSGHFGWSHSSEC